MVLIRILPVCFTVIVFINFRTSRANNTVCYTAECKELGRLYSINMNPRVNPCNDFYEFACSGFAERHKDTLFYNYWGVESEMKTKVYEDLKKLLDYPAKSPNPKFQRAKAVYKACANTGYVTRTDMASVLRMAVNKIAWPILHPNDQKPSLDSSCWLTDKHYIKLAGYSAFYGFNIVPHQIYPYNIITELTAPVSPYGVILRTVNWGHSELFNYKMFLHRLIRMVALSNTTPPEVALDVDLNELLTFRENMRKIIQETSLRRDVPWKVNIFQFQQWYNHQVTATKTAEINWLEVIRAMYNIPENQFAPSITPLSEIIVEKNYFTNLARLMGATKRRVLENHIHLHFLERSITIDAQMKVELRKSVDEKFTGKFIHEVPRWQGCIDNSNINNVLAEMYLKEYFPKEKKNDVTRMIEETQRLLIKQISQSNWLNDKTKAKSKRKIVNIKSDVGYSRLNLPDDIDPLSADIYYEPQLNRIAVSAGNLQLPVYGKNLPFWVTFGATITSLGHEIYHAFDTEGLQYNRYGNTPWWEQDMLRIHNKQLQCFKSHYDNFKKTNYNKYGVKYYNQLPSTVNEDYTDAMGLKLAYKGFKEKLQERNGVCQTLPGLENFGCYKLFFLAFANTYCMYATPGLKAKYIERETHSLPEVRVNAAVTNVHDFSTVFGCKPNDPLNSQERCDIWQR